MSRSRVNSTFYNTSRNPNPFDYPKGNLTFEKKPHTRLNSGHPNKNGNLLHSKVSFVDENSRNSDTSKQKFESTRVTTAPTENLRKGNHSFQQRYSPYRNLANGSKGECDEVFQIKQDVLSMNQE